MSIGFTGTQQGMTHWQCDAVLQLLSELKPSKVGHGDCIGSDQQFHQMVKWGFPHIFIYGHPPKNPSKRAFCHFDYLYPEKDYLDRNKDIAEKYDIIIATPKEDEEVLRSGTWSTVRYAKKLGKKVYIVKQDGSVE